MSKLPLSLACWDYDRTRPLIDGRVQPEGIDLKVQIMRPREAFQRMLDFKEFDVSEISLASFVACKAAGNCPFIGLPVVLSKMFRHDCIYVRTDAGIKTPADLKGKRIGATQFASTGVVFIKGMLQHEYGIRPEDMSWFIGGLNGPNHRPATPPPPPLGTRIEYLPDDRTLEAMLEANELDALFALYIPSIFERRSPRIARLFPDYKRVEQDYFRRTSICPIMHAVVIREDTHKEHPWVARSLYKAFCDARDIALDGLYDTDALRLSLPFLIDHIEETRAIFGEDFWAYGLEPNRPTLAAIGQYMHEQGLAARVVSPDEMFVSGLD